MKLDEKKKAEIRARLEGASSGPWYEFASKLKVRTPQDAKDAAFMAHARQDVEDLLDDLKTTEGLVKFADELRADEMEAARQALVRAETAERELAIAQKARLDAEAELAGGRMEIARLRNLVEVQTPTGSKP